MSIEPDKATFVRLVWLNIALFALMSAVSAFEWFGTRFGAVAGEMEAVAAQRYGPADPSWTAIVTLGIVILWGLASMIDLMFFHRWARLGFWLAPLAAIAVMMSVEGVRPTVTSPVLDLVALADSAAYGALIFMSYARGLGDAWFNPAPILKD